MDNINIMTILNIFHLIYLFYSCRGMFLPALFYTGFGSLLAIMLIAPLTGSFILFLLSFYANMLCISYSHTYYIPYWWIFYLEGFWQTSMIIFSI